MYKCYFCQFVWKNIYSVGDKTPRPEEEATGSVCPRCLLPQNKEDTWKTKIRKFLYGKGLSKDTRFSIEEFLSENFNLK